MLGGVFSAGLIALAVDPLSATLTPRPAYDSSLLLPRAGESSPPAEAVLPYLEKLVVTTHVVRNGETLNSIAKRYGTSAATVRAINGLEYNYLAPGRSLRIVNKKGCFYRGRGGETLTEVADRFHVSAPDLAALHGRSPVDVLEAGTEIFLPGVTPRFRDFAYPVHGRVTSRFGHRHHPIFGVTRMHEGLDLKYPPRAPVKAARDGRVTFAGWKAGYGKLVELSHAGGYQTRYGHLSKILVRPGQRVQSGQLVGRIGSTGWATGPHLHFEIRRNGQPVNPLRYLGTRPS